MSAENEVTLKVEHGALAEVPVWESHKRGKNWAASIAIDPKAPGGIDRTFWERANGAYYYIVPTGLVNGTPVEFAGDYVTTSGGREPNRCYGIVVDHGPHSITIAGYEDARQVCEAAAIVRQAEGMADKPSEAAHGDPIADALLGKLRAAISRPVYCDTGAHEGQHLVTVADLYLTDDEMRYLGF